MKKPYFIALHVRICFFILYEGKYSAVRFILESEFGEMYNFKSLSCCRILFLQKIINSLNETVAYN